MITVGDMVSRPGVQDPKTSSSSREPPRVGEVSASGRVLSQLHGLQRSPCFHLEPVPPRGLPTQGSVSKALSQLATESVLPSLALCIPSASRSCQA